MTHRKSCNATLDASGIFGIGLIVNEIVGPTTTLHIAILAGVLVILGMLFDSLRSLDAANPETLAVDTTQSGGAKHSAPD